MNHCSCWILVIVLVLHVQEHVHATWNHVCIPEAKPHPHGICGSHISEMLDLLCFNGYNEYPSDRKKRSEDSSSLAHLDEMLLPKEQATAYLNKRSSYYQRGIACECCYHQCSIPELISYCKSGPNFGF